MSQHAPNPPVPPPGAVRMPEDWVPDFRPPVVPPDARRPGIGVIGAGFIVSDCHVPAYRDAGLRVVACTSRTPESARALAEKHSIPRVHPTVADLVADPDVQVVDVAVPPDAQADVIATILRRGRGKIRGILAQKPLGVELAEAVRIERACREAGVLLAVNQNMRFDQAVRACRGLLTAGVLGRPVLATLDMRAIPHWMPWQERQGWLTLRIMSIHHFDTFRYWFGNPVRIHTAVTPDPRTKFPHSDGVCVTTLEFDGGPVGVIVDDVWTGPAREGAASDIGIRWRVEGAHGYAVGTVGWPDYPAGSPSTIDWSTVHDAGRRHSPRWPDRWFPHAFAGPMADLLIALHEMREPMLNGRDNLRTMALVEAAYRSAAEHRVVALSEFPV